MHSMPKIQDVHFDNLSLGRKRERVSEQNNDKDMSVCVQGVLIDKTVSMGCLLYVDAVVDVAVVVAIVFA